MEFLIKVEKKLSLLIINYLIVKSNKQMAVIRKRYTKQEKLEIVSESLEDGVQLIDLSERYSLHVNTISRWRREYGSKHEAAFPGNGNVVLSEDEKEIKRLRKELEESVLSNEILKKAMGIITSPSRRNLLS